jgi:hypothetical protein
MSPHAPLTVLRPKSVSAQPEALGRRCRSRRVFDRLALLGSRRQQSEPDRHTPQERDSPGAVAWRKKIACAHARTSSAMGCCSPTSRASPPNENVDRSVSDTATASAIARNDTHDPANLDNHASSAIGSYVDLHAAVTWKRLAEDVDLGDAQRPDASEQGLVPPKRPSHSPRRSGNAVPEQAPSANCIG